MELVKNACTQQLWSRLVNLLDTIWESKIKIVWPNVFFLLNSRGLERPKAPRSCLCGGNCGDGRNIKFNIVITYNARGRIHFWAYAKMISLLHRWLLVNYSERKTRLSSARYYISCDNTCDRGRSAWDYLLFLFCSHTRKPHISSRHCQIDTTQTHVRAIRRCLIKITKRNLRLVGLLVHSKRVLLSKRNFFTEAIEKKNGRHETSRVHDTEQLAIIFPLQWHQARIGRRFSTWKTDETDPLLLEHIISLVVL